MPLALRLKGVVKQLAATRVRDDLRKGTDPSRDDWCSLPERLDERVAERLVAHRRCDVRDREPVQRSEPFCREMADEGHLERALALLDAAELWARGTPSERGLLEDRIAWSLGLVEGLLLAEWFPGRDLLALAFGVVLVSAAMWAAAWAATWRGRR